MVFGKAAKAAKQNVWKFRTIRRALESSGLRHGVDFFEVNNREHEIKIPWYFAARRINTAVATLLPIPYYYKLSDAMEKTDQQNEEILLKSGLGRLRQIAKENKPNNGKFTHALLSHFGGKTYLLTEEALAKFQEKRPTKKVVKLN